MLLVATNRPSMPPPAPAIVGGIDGLIEATRSISNPDERLLLLWKLAQPLLLAGDQPALQRLAGEALAIVRPAIAAGKPSISVGDIGRILLLIAWAQAEGGDSLGALSTIDDAFVVRKASQGTIDRDTDLSIASTIRAMAHAMQQAIATADEIVDPAMRATALSRVAVGRLW